MQGLNENGVKLRAALRRISLTAALFGAVVALPMIAGCPPVMMPTCESDDDCTDDGAFCNGAETCVEGTCQSAGSPCTESQTCDEDADACLDCTDDAGCDDMDACTTDTCTNGTCSNEAVDCDDNDACTNDSCDADTGDCVNTDVECADGEVCVNGNCNATCTSAADCPDEPCVTETCTEGICLSTVVDCDDGVACTDDSCNMQTDACENVSNCPDGQVCNTDTGACEVQACTTNADCNDGNFCNGEETCDTNTEVCQAGTNPCDAATETCNEETDTCENNTEGMTFTLTLGQDNVTGTAGDDTINAPLEFNPGTGTNLATLQTQDMVAGGAGSGDTMSAQMSAAANTITPTISGVESISWTDFGTGTTTLAATNVTGLNSFTSTSSTQDVIVTNLPAALTSLGITNSTQDLTVGFLTAATSGTSNALTLNLSNATGRTSDNQTVTINTGTTNGFESMTVNSAGGPNDILDIVQGTGNTLATMNFSGDQSLNIQNALDNSVTTLDASGSTGGVSIFAGNGAVTFTGGTGADTARFAAGEFTSADTVNGGDGNDFLRLTSADADNATAALTNVSNIEGLAISDAMAGAVNATFYGSIANVNLEAGITGGNTLTVATGTTVTFGFDGATNDSAGNNTLAVGGLGTNDTVTVVYNDSDSGGSTTFNGIEVVNLQSNLNESGAAADGNANVFTGAFTLPDVAGSSLNITGSEDVTFTAAVTARVISGATFVNRISMTLNTSGATTTSTVATGGGTITGGTNNDILVGSTAGDTINTTGGNDVAQPGRGIDTVNFGAGSCILDLEDLAVAQALAANRVTATGFTANGTDYSTTNEVDAISFDDLGVGDLSDGASAAEFQTVTTPANVTAGAGVAIVELSYEFSSGVDLDNDLTGTALLSACGATTGTTACTFTTQANDDDIVIIAYQSSNAYIYHGNGAGGDTNLVAGEIALIAVVTGDVTVGGFNNTNFVD